MWVILGLSALVGVTAGVVLAEKKHADALALLEDATERQGTGALTGAMRVPSGHLRDITEPDPESLRGIPAYPGSHPRRLVDVPNNKLTASWFYTDDSVEKVVAYYQEAFARQGVSTNTQRYNRGRAAIAWLERYPGDSGVSLPDGLMHAVTVLPEGRRTLVLFSSADPLLILKNAQKLPGWFERPANAGRPQVLDLSIEGMPRQTVYLVLKDTTGEQAAEMMKSTYTAKGWSLKGTPSPVSNAISFEREGAQLKISLTEKPAGTVEAILTLDGTGAAQ